MFWIYFTIWAILFAVCYVLLRYRQKILDIRYSSCEPDMTMIVSVVVPPVGIVFALVEITCFHLGLRKPGERAI